MTISDKANLAVAPKQAYCVVACGVGMTAMVRCLTLVDVSTLPASTRKASLTSTGEAAVEIKTVSRQAAVVKSTRAFIYVHAGLVHRQVTLAAEADEAPYGVTTKRTAVAVIRHLHTLIHVSAHLAIAMITIPATTGVTPHCIGAVGCGTALMGAPHTLILVQAGLPITFKSREARACIGSI